MAGKGKFGGKKLLEMAGEALTSPKFLEYIEGANLGDLVNSALHSPFGAQMVESLTRMAEDLKERYEITGWKWHADRENNRFVIELEINTKEMRTDFVTHFGTFMSDLQAKFGGGFDMFIQLYRIEKYSCVEVDNKVEIVFSTSRVADLEAVILEISSADVNFEGDDKNGGEG